MNKTYRINLAGFPFEIDDNAYDLLKDYLDTLKSAFSSAHYDDDLIVDIESRIAEILQLRMGSAYGIVSLKMVEDVISRVGKPEEIVEADVSVEDAPEGEKVVEEQVEVPPLITPPPLPRIRRRLYRDKRNKEVAGVCSGIATYFGIDVVWVRLAVIALFFFSMSGVSIFYVAMMIVVPEAKTPLQYMELEGESPTISNIGKTVTDTYYRWKNGDSAGTDSGNKFFKVITDICAVLMKSLLWIVAVAGVPVMLLSMILLTLCIYWIVKFPDAVYTYSIFERVADCSDPRAALAMVIGGIIACLGPLLAYEVAMFNYCNNRPLLSKSWGFVTAALWCMGILLFSVFRHFVW